MTEQDKDYIADAIAAENVRLFMDGALVNPHKDTLAWHVARLSPAARFVRKYLGWLVRG